MGSTSPASDPTAATGSTGSQTGDGSSQPGLSECREAAQEGLELLEASVQVVKGDITSDDYDAQLREVFMPANAECLDALEEVSTHDAQPEACQTAGRYAREAGSHVIGTATADTVTEADQERREGLSSLRRAGASWRACYPGEELPEELEL